MTERRWFILAHDTARTNALECVRTAPDMMELIGAFGAQHGVMF